MPKLVSKPSLNLDIVFTINESEARALDALVGYGDDAFIEAFKAKLGAHYLSNHEDGLRSVFKGLREFLPGALSQLDEARKVFNGK